VVAEISDLEQAVSMLVLGRREPLDEVRADRSVLQELHHPGRYIVRIQCTHNVEVLRLIARDVAQTQHGVGLGVVAWANHARGLAGQKVGSFTMVM
jgi:hypothetical protein